MVTIRITPIAWMKMQTLVMGYDKEVGWFGTCEELGPLDFRIKDILVFPQYTSGCYVDDERDDPLEFRNWLNTLDDETYNSRRLWGHSHVNMGVSPSGTDTAMFKRFADTSCAALENRFAICVILNKRADMHWWAFDGVTNKAYDKKEINVMIEVEDGVSNLEFFESTKSLVRDIRPTTAFLFNRGYGNSSSLFGDDHELAAGYNYGSYNSYIESRQESKKESKKKEQKDDQPSFQGATKYLVETMDEDEDDYAPYYEDSYDEVIYDDVAYDVEITKDSVIVTEISNLEIGLHERVLEDMTTGLICRFRMNAEELVPDHPLQKDTVGMTLLSTAAVNPLFEFFTVCIETDAENGEVAYTDLDCIDPFNEQEVLDLLLMPIDGIEYLDKWSAVIYVERGDKNECK